MTGPLPQHPTSLRERSKQARRDRIVDSTYVLLREIGLDAVSVTMVAERAQVSPTTVYNLFGTKDHVLAHVFDRDLRAYRETVERARAADALDRIFKAVTIAADLYKTDPGFYRATMRVQNGQTDAAIYRTIRQPRIAFWQNMLQEARNARFLRPDTDCNVLGVLLTHIVGGTILEWAEGSITADRLEKEIAFGFAASLLPFATARGTDRLRPRLRKLKAMLAKDSRHKEAGG